MKSWGLPLFVPILQSPSSSPRDLFTLDRIIPLLKTHSTLAEKQTPYHDIPQTGPCPPCLRPSPSINCVRPNNGSSGSTKDQVLIPGSCEYVHLLGKKNSAEVIKLRILRREIILDYPGGPNDVITMVLVRTWEVREGDETMEVEIREREIWRRYAAGFEDGVRNYEPGNADSR